MIVALGLPVKGIPPGEHKEEDAADAPPVGSEACKECALIIFVVVASVALWRAEVERTAALAHKATSRLGDVGLRVQGGALQCLRVRPEEG